LYFVPGAEPAAAAAAGTLTGQLPLLSRLSRFSIGGNCRIQGTIPPDLR
jgi:hypothetical protein